VAELTVPTTEGGGPQIAQNGRFRNSVSLRSALLMPVLTMQNVGSDVTFVCDHCFKSV